MRGGASSLVRRVYASRGFLWFLAAVGVGLRVSQYLRNRSLWLDEARIVLYIIGRSFGGLLEPLEGIPGTRVQSAPAAFLILQKLVVTAFGSSEYALRLLPLACGLVSLFVCVGVARRFLVPAAVPVAVLLFAVCEPLILYASEVKQYAGDVLATLLVLWVLPDAGRGTPSLPRTFGLAALGAALVFFSDAVVFVLAGCGLVAAQAAWRRGDHVGLFRLTGVGAAWCAAVAGAYGLTMRHAMASGMLQHYWAHAFLPLPPASLDDIARVGEALVEFFAKPIGFVPPLLGAILFVVGFVAMLRRRPVDLACLLLPLGLVLAASGLRVYPFEGRLLLFCVPLVVPVIAAGVERVHTGVARVSPFLAAVVALLLLSEVMVRAIEASGAPTRPEETRPLLEHVRARWQPGDVLVVPPQGRAGMLYYAPRYGFTDADYVFVDSNDRWQAVIDGLAARRVWVSLPTVRLPETRPTPARSIHERLAARGREIDRIETPGAQNYLYELFAAPASRAAAAPPAAADGDRRYNVLFISIDSLRADHLGCYGYRRETSPTIDRLAREGVLFETAVADSSWTLPTHASMLTGLPQGVHGLRRGRARLAPGVVTLPEVLRAAGYRTRGLWSGPYLHPVFGFDQGFAPGDYEGVIGAICYDDPGFAGGGDDARQTAVEQTHRLAHRSVTSPELVRRAEAFLATAGENPFLLFLHFFDVHYDYVPPEAYWRRFDPGYDGGVTARDFGANAAIHRGMAARDLEHIVALYDGEILFTDTHIGHLLSALDRLGLAGRTLVVLTSDHGEEFFEHGEKGHRNNLYDETLLVPLIMRLPGVLPAGRRVSSQVRQIDIMPTILDLLGLPVPATVMGASVAAAATGGASGDAGPAVARLVRRTEGARERLTAARFGTTKIVRVERDGEERIELYDLERDPGERAPLDGAGLDRRLPGAVRALAEVAETESRARERLGLDGGGDATLPPDVEEALRALGYLR
jgi:arylsulfatase A-like enzyme